MPLRYKWIHLPSGLEGVKEFVEGTSRQEAWDMLVKWNCQMPTLWVYLPWE